jgi:hypothetical protein
MRVLKTLLLILTVTLAVAALFLFARRATAVHRIDRFAESLCASPSPAVFSTEALNGLPEAAQRYFRRAIAPGTPLASAVRLSMRGSFLLQRGGERIPMSAEQVLAPPRGFVWKARMGGGLMRISGFDAYYQAEGELRWWLWSLVPLVRGQGPDVSRSAAGRLAMESVLLPSSLLPERGARWKEGAAGTLSVALRVDEGHFEVGLTLDSDGRLLRAQMPRWGDARGDGNFGEFLFEVESEAERRFGGYTIPSRLKAGWRFPDGTFHDFFHAEILEADFSGAGAPD